MFFLIIAIVSVSGAYAPAGDLTRDDAGTVTDNTTGLMWQQVDDNKRYVWEAALNYCGDLSLAGFSDWRLPTLKELVSIIEYEKYSPATDGLFFPDTNLDNYWSSSVFALDSSYAWNAGFRYGIIVTSKKLNGCYVRCVRDRE